MSQAISPVEYSKVEVAPTGEPLLPVSLDLVGDIQVQLTGHIGRCTMSVAELYGLKKGTIVSLGSDVEEPITLTLNGKVVARGKLVAQDGQFALEITDVAVDGRQI